MIIRLRQIETNFDMSYEAVSNGDIICKVFAPFTRSEVHMGCSFSTGLQTKLYFNPRDTSGGRTLEERMSFKLYEGEAFVGRFVGATQKTGKIFGGYPYYKLVYHGKEYQAYEVGMGGDGLFLCIYYNGRTVAIASKIQTVVDFQDNYTIYLESKDDASLAILTLLYYDIINYGDLMEIARRSTRLERKYTPQKELRAKYDPEFIPKILAMEER